MFKFMFIYYFENLSVYKRKTLVPILKKSIV